VLTALAVRRSSPVQLRLLEQLHGKPDLDEAGADALRSVLTATGARAAVEDMIVSRHVQALAVLDSFPFASAVCSALRRIADKAVCRTG